MLKSLRTLYILSSVNAVNRYCYWAVISLRLIDTLKFNFNGCVVINNNFNTALILIIEISYVICEKIQILSKVVELKSK